MSKRKRILFIVPYPQGQAPSQRFRFEQYIPFLEMQGFDVTLKPFLDEKGWQVLYHDGNYIRKALAILRSFFKRFALLFTVRRYHTVFIHREASMIGPPILEWIIAKALKKKYIYDFDDAIWLPNYSESNAKFQALKMYGKVRSIMKWADTITAGNTYLVNYAKRYNDKVLLIPTTIDTENVHNLNGNPDQTIPVIGWTGSHTTAQYLNDLIPILDELHTRIPFVFRIISNLNPKIARDYVEFVKWDKQTEIQDLASFNIGVMPLHDSEWEKGKCGFKALQYMALGIPCVVSPVGMNTELVKHGINGFLCDSREDWQRHLEALLTDPVLRKKLGEAGKKCVVENYSVQCFESTYLSLFQ